MHLHQILQHLVYIHINFTKILQHLIVPSSTTAVIYYLSTAAGPVISNISREEGYLYRISRIIIRVSFLHCRCRCYRYVVGESIVVAAGAGEPSKLPSHDCPPRKSLSSALISLILTSLTNKRPLNMPVRVQPTNHSVRCIMDQSGRANSGCV